MQNKLSAAEVRDVTKQIGKNKLGMQINTNSNNSKCVTNNSLFSKVWSV